MTAFVEILKYSCVFKIKRNVSIFNNFDLQHQGADGNDADLILKSAFETCDNPRILRSYNSCITLIERRDITKGGSKIQIFGI